MNDEIRVGIAEFNMAFSPDKLITVGLGSCIGIALFDKIKGVGGLLHIMLPDSRQFVNVNNPLKYADLGLPIMMKALEGKGAKISNLTAKIAGGASMFNFSDKSLIMDIGSRNSVSVKNILKEYSIPLLGEDIGGNKGRTMIFDTFSGKVIVKTVGMGVSEL